MKSFHQKARSVFSFLLQRFLLLLIRLAFRPKVVYASEKARLEAFAGPRVIIANHVRGMDAAVMYSLFSRQPFTALAAKDILDSHPVLKRFLSFMPVTEIDRQNASLGWLRSGRQALREGRHVVIFPEGKCQFDRVTKPLKPGCVLPASSAGASILPMYHNGTYHYFFGKRFRLIIGEPVPVTPPPEGLQTEELQRQADALFRTLNDLERQLTGSVRGQEDPAA